MTILGEVEIQEPIHLQKKILAFLQALGLAGDLTIDGNRKI